MDAWQTFRTYRDTWLRIGLDCRPADRARAEAAITALYRSSRETAPDFVWAASPAEMLRRIPPPEKPTAWVPLLYDHIRVKTQREPDGGHGELLDLLWSEIRYAQQRVSLVPSPIIGGLRAAAHAVCQNPLPNTLRYALYHYLTLPLQRIVWEGIARLVFRALKETNEPAAALPSLLYGQHDVPHPPYMMMVNRSSGRGKPPVCVVRILSVPCFLPACSWRAWISSYPATPRASRTASPIGTNGFPLGVGA
jgi:hypothetical protein